MDQVHRMENPIMEYAWGSREAIARLLGRTVPSENPQAELWMGAHPKAPSRVSVDGRWTSLIDWIGADAEARLGGRVMRRFGPQLPFLLKVLAAARPLSIQAHPSRDEAREGFGREDRQQIPLGAPQRNYRDENHKPECICALTPFWALNGFRPLKELAEMLSKFCPRALSAADSRWVVPSDTAGLRTFFQKLMTLPDSAGRQLISEAVGRAGQDTSREARWIERLQADYPWDIGVLAPLFLNLIQLAPGQALYLPSGHLHAYLEGTGIELMANSDNVLRGGLTPKHIDVPELLRVVRFRARKPNLLSPVQSADGSGVYPCEAGEFELAVIGLEPGRSHVHPTDAGIEILLCTLGSCRLTTGQEQRVDFSAGQSVLVPATIDRYRLTGSATVYRAAVPS